MTQTFRGVLPPTLRPPVHSGGRIGMGLAMLRCAAESARHRPSTSSPRPDVCRTRTGHAGLELPTQDAPYRGAAAYVPPSSDVHMRCRQVSKESEATATDRQPDPDPAQRKRSRFDGVLLQEPLSLSSNAFAPYPGEVCPAKPRTLVQMERQTGRQMTKRIKVRRQRKKVDATGYAKSAGKCASGSLRDAVSSAWTATDQAKHNTRKLGTFGAASPVVRINPETMEPFE